MDQDPGDSDVGEVNDDILDEESDSDSGDLDHQSSSYINPSDFLIANMKVEVMHSLILNKYDSNWMRL